MDYMMPAGTVLPLNKNHTLYVDTPMYHKVSIDATFLIFNMFLLTGILRLF